jgi:hypothetical protein
MLLKKYILFSRLGANYCHVPGSVRWYRLAGHLVHRGPLGGQPGARARAARKPDNA